MWPQKKASMLFSEAPRSALLELRRSGAEKVKQGGTQHLGPCFELTWNRILPLFNRQQTLKAALGLCVGLGNVLDKDFWFPLQAPI